MMRSQKSFVMFAAAAAIATAGLAGCKKKKDKAPEPTMTPSASASPSPTTTPPPAPPKLEIDANGDWVQVLASHSPGRPTDPITLLFKSPTVTQVAFTSVDDLTGGSASFELDIGAMASGQAMREGHLKSGDYFDVATFPKATVKVSSVKKTEGDKYSAEAEVTVHGVTVKWPVTFEVFEKKDKTVRVRGEVATKRSEFKLGKPEGTPDETAADAVTAKLQLTLTAP